MPTGVAMAATHLGNGAVRNLSIGDLSSGKIGGEEAEAEVEQTPDVTGSPMPRSSAEIACEPTPRPLTRLVHTAKPLRASAVDVPIDERHAVTVRRRARARRRRRSGPLGDPPAGWTARQNGSGDRGDSRPQDAAARWSGGLSSVDCVQLDVRVHVWKVSALRAAFRRAWTRRPRHACNASTCRCAWTARARLAPEPPCTTRSSTEPALTSPADG